MPTNQRTERPGPLSALGRDESGAIMVMGIFMCACMVGLLWYLAGIGDAIVYRERMQEASDAVALSGAMLMARGMNLIVLINLIMAAILAIRVALRAVEAICLVVGAILTATIFLAEIGAALLDIAEVLNTIVEDTREPMDTMIKALSKVEVGIQWIAPPAALVGSHQVGNHYNAPVSETAAGNPATLGSGLPVAEDTPDKLCGKAGETVVEVIGDLIPIIPSSVLGRIKSGVGKLVEAGASYFCGLSGDASGIQDQLKDMANAGQDEACDGEIQKLQQDADAATKAYNDACVDFVECGGTKTPSPSEQSNLATLAAKRDTANDAVNNWDRDECKKRKGEEINSKIDSGTKSKSDDSSGSGMTPKKVKDDWYNGTKDAQLVSFATGNTKFADNSKKGVLAGAWKSKVDINTPTTAQFGMAQAEFYYDCTSSWNSGDCTDQMWNFYWRARLHRYSAPFSDNPVGLEKITEVISGADAIAKVLQNNPLKVLSFQSAGVIADTLEAARGDLIIH